MVEPVTVAVIAIASLLMVGAGAALAMWHRILDWGRQNVLPWLEKNLPGLAANVRSAFNKIDEVAVHIRRLIHAQWKELRRWLLKQTTEIKRKVTGNWQARTISWIAQRLDESQPRTVVKVTTTEEVAWDELPSDIRAEYINSNQQEKEVNVTKIRDDEIDKDVLID